MVVFAHFMLAVNNLNDLQCNSVRETKCLFPFFRLDVLYHSHIEDCFLIVKFFIVVK